MTRSDNVRFWSKSGNWIDGTKVYPEDSTGKFVLFVHGFIGNKDENGLFTEAANRFAQKGIPSLRFDFSGHGGSDGDTRNLTLDQEVKDYRSAIDHINMDDRPRELIVVGFSLGATVAIKAKDERVSQYIFWSPAFYPKIDMVPRYRNDPSIQEQIVNNGSFIKSGKFVNGAILNELDHFELYRYINHIDRTIRIIHGTSDERIDHRRSKRFARYYSRKKNIEQHYIDGAGHSYKEKPSYRNEVYDQSVNWILSPMSS
jgi:alpha-beta hydrolase superfamily lysophospholipase